MNDKGVCRTAQATPGLLINILKTRKFLSTQTIHCCNTVFLEKLTMHPLNNLLLKYYLGILSWFAFNVLQSK